MSRTSSAAIAASRSALAVGIAALDDDVLALDVAGFAQALAKARLVGIGCAAASARRRTRAEPIARRIAGLSPRSLRRRGSARGSASAQSSQQRGRAARQRAATDAGARARHRRRSPAARKRFTVSRNCFRLIGLVTNASKPE